MQCSTVSVLTIRRCFSVKKNGMFFFVRRATICQHFSSNYRGNGNNITVWIELDEDVAVIRIVTTGNQRGAICRLYLLTRLSFQGPSVFAKILAIADLVSGMTAWAKVSLTWDRSQESSLSIFGLTEELGCDSTSQLFFFRLPIVINSLIAGSAHSRASNGCLEASNSIRRIRFSLVMILNFHVPDKIFVFLKNRLFHDLWEG